MLYCQECGNKCNEDMKFCSNCGAKLPQIENNEPQESKETEVKNNEQELVSNQNENLNEHNFQQDNSVDVENNSSDNSEQASGVVIEKPVHTENTVNNNQSAQFTNNNNWNYNQGQNVNSNNSWNYSTNQNNMNKPQANKSGFGIASLVIGILSCIYEFFVLGALLFVGFSGFYVLSLILGIIGVVLGVLGIKKSKGISIAGIVINAIVILSSLFFLILGGVLRLQDYRYNGIQNHDYYEDRFDDYYDDDYTIFDDIY